MSGIYIINKQLKSQGWTFDLFAVAHYAEHLAMITFDSEDGLFVFTGNLTQYIMCALHCVNY